MRQYKVKIQHTMTVPEKEMRTVLAERAGILDLTDDKELEWAILDDPGTVNGLELLAVLAKVSVKIQVSVLRPEDGEFIEDEEPEERSPLLAPDEELDPEAVAAVAQEKVEKLLDNGHAEDSPHLAEARAAVQESDHGKLAQETVAEWRESDVLVMLNQGKSLRKIAKKTGIPYEKVRAIQKKYADQISQEAPEGHPT